MRVKQKRPTRHVKPPSPSPSPIGSPISDETDCASITSNLVEVSCPFSISSIRGTTSLWIGWTNKKRKEDETTICNIPKSVMQSIFLRIPALTLRRMTRYVCKEWNGIISDPEFVREHSILNPSDGFLIQKFIHGNDYPSLSYLVEIRNDNNAVTIHPTSLLFETVHASSGGFLFIEEDTPDSKFSDFAVLDPVSENKLNLPPLSITGLRLLFSGFAQDPSTGIYKVVHFCSENCCDEFCFVLSLGVESNWRPLGVPIPIAISLFNRITISAGRYVYCVTSGADGGFHIMTFDAQTESIYFFFTEFTNLKRNSRYYFLRMEDSLSLVISRKNYKWKVWKLTNSRIWELICKIDMSSQECLIERELSEGDVFIKPLTWLRNGELILFRLTYPSLCCIAYDVGKGDFFWFKFPDDDINGKLARFHVNGIFSLNMT